MKKSKIKTDGIEKNKKKVLIVVLAIMAILLIGATYAWLNTTVSGTKVNIIKAGTISFDFKEGDNKIFVQNAYPLTDTEGEETTIYEFTVTNDGNISSDYELLLGDLPIDSGKTRMDDGYVKYKLEKIGKKTEVITQLMSKPDVMLIKNENSENVKYRKLDDETLEPNESKTYKLQVWMDYDAPNEAQGTIFKTKIAINGIQHNR